MGQQCYLPRFMAPDHLQIDLLGKLTSMNTNRNVTECPCLVSLVTVFLCITILIDTRLVITMGKDILEWLIPRFDHRCSSVHRCIPVTTTIIATGPRSIKTESASGAVLRCAECRHRCPWVLLFFSALFFLSLEIDLIYKHFMKLYNIFDAYYTTNWIRS